MRFFHNFVLVPIFHVYFILNKNYWKLFDHYGESWTYALGFCRIGHLVMVRFWHAYPHSCNLAFNDGILLLFFFFPFNFGNFFWGTYWLLDQLQYVPSVMSSMLNGIKKGSFFRNKVWLILVQFSLLEGTKVDLCRNLFPEIRPDLF